MKAATDTARLRFLAAARLESPAGDLDRVALHDAAGEPLGHLAGVLIDPPARCIRYFVVEKPGWLRRRVYLIPSDCAARMEPEALRLELGPGELGSLEEFDSREVSPFSIEDTVDAMFGRAG